MVWHPPLAIPSAVCEQRPKYKYPALLFIIPCNIELKHFVVVCVSNRLALPIWFCIPARCVLGAFGRGRHYGRMTTFLYITRHPTSSHFPTILKRLKSSVVRFSWCLFCIGRPIQARKCFSTRKCWIKIRRLNTFNVSLASIGNWREIGHGS